MSQVSLVGIGADGWDGLAPPARAVIERAQVLFGSTRQLRLIPAAVPAERVRWPSPLLPALPGVLAEHAGRRRCVLASGDPMFYGIGRALVDLLGIDQVRVLPAPSSVSLACARLGWSLEAVDVLSLVARPVTALTGLLAPGRRLLVLGCDASSLAQVAALLTARGYGSSALTVLSNLGAEDETAVAGRAEQWTAVVGPLHVIAVECGQGPLLPAIGLPDDCYEHDGQLTKRDVRSVTVARLSPAPGQLLWDVGAGAGSIAIEWLRAERTAAAVAIESRPDRAARIERNAAALGVPQLAVSIARAPAGLAGLPDPDAIFIGGGLTAAGLVESCWQRLRPSGRLVANAVTLESEAVLLAAHAGYGGELVRLGMSVAAPVGGFTGWRPAMPVTQWSVCKQ